MLRPFLLRIVASVFAPALGAAAAFAQTPSPVPISGWSLLFVDSQETAGENGAASNAFDGDPATYWHSQWQSSKPNLPHEIRIDLGTTYEIAGFRQLPRQDGKPNGRIGQYEFYVSGDGISWGGPVASGAFPATATESEVLFPATPARYVRLRALTDQSGTTYRTSLAELTVLRLVSHPLTPIPRTTWSVHFVDSEETAAANNAGANVFDGDPSTFWHSEWSTTQPPLPHEIQLDLGASYTVAGFRYLPRQDGRTNGRIGQFEFYTSSDGIHWGTPAAAGTFANTADEKQVEFAPRSGRYVRLRALSDLSGTNRRTSAAEINVLQTTTANLPPDGLIDSPAGAVTIPLGGTVNFLGSGSDPDGNLPLSYRWTFGAGSGIADATAQNPGLVAFNTPGTFNVIFTVTDALGTPDPSPSVRTVSVQPPSATQIPPANWGVHFVDSQETAADNNAAANAFDGNPATLWHTEWSLAKPTLPHELQINLSGTYTISGFRYLPRQDGRPNGRIGQYEFYVSTDGVNWGSPAASGTFANDATEKQVEFSPRAGQYVRLRALTDQSGTNYRTSAAEIAVLQIGSPTNVAPNGTIDSPLTDLTIGVGDSVTFSGNASDPDNHTPLSYRWNFGAGSGIPDSAQLSPGSVQFNQAGTFVVRFTATDALGLADGSPSSRRITVQPPASVLLPRTGWTLLYADSYEPASVFAGKSGSPQNAFDGNPRTLWHTRSVNSQPPPPHEIQLDLGTTYTIAGFKYLPRQDNLPKGRIGRFEFYVTTNPGNWGAPVATGLFEDTELERQVFFAPKSGRFVRLRALTEANGYPFTAVAELNVLALGSTSTAAPNAIIASPASDVTVSAGSVVQFGSSASDPDNNPPFHYRWTFSPSADRADIDLPNPGYIEFNTPGVHTVTLHVADGWGMADATPATRTITVQGGTPIPTAGWSVQAVDSEDLAGNHPGVHAIDGNTATFWQTLPGVLPHTLDLDLGAFHDIGGLRYVARQDGTEGRLDRYQFFVSTDGVNWLRPLARGAFSNTAAPQELQFGSAVARFVRLQALTEVNSLPSTSVAEIGLLQPSFVAPTIRLLQPRSYCLQTSGNLRVRADGFVPAGYGVRLAVDGGNANGGAQVDDYAWPFDQLFGGVSAGEHTVTATILDPAGNPTPGLTGQDHAVQVGIGDYYLALGDSITYGVADDFTPDNVSQDGRNRGGGFTPILADMLTAAAGRPVHIANEGKPGEFSSGGAARIRSVLARHPDAQRVLIMYGTNDAGGYDGFPVPSGLGLSPGDTGYPGSFKSNLQQIVTAILEAGKEPVLAKVPFVLGFPDFDQRVQEYNLVIDELVANPANQITVTPPDFHAYFAAYASTEYYQADAVHPNGVGFQSMAELWFEALTATP